MPPLVETRNAKANVDLSTFSLQTQKDGISKEKKGRMVVHIYACVSFTGITEATFRLNSLMGKVKLDKV